MLNLFKKYKDKPLLLILAPVFLEGISSYEHFYFFPLDQIVFVIPHQPKKKTKTKKIPEILYGNNGFFKVIIINLNFAVDRQNNSQRHVASVIPLF